MWGKAVVLNRGRFCPLGNIWQRLETFLVVTTVEGRRPTCIYWIEVKDDTKIFTTYQKAPQYNYPAI